jgi:acyl-CoA-binding protein
VPHRKTKKRKEIKQQQHPEIMYLNGLYALFVTATNVDVDVW